MVESGTVSREALAGLGALARLGAAAGGPVEGPAEVVLVAEGQLREAGSEQRA